MKVELIEKGKRAGLPCSVVNPDADGWTAVVAPEDGLKVCLDAKESSGGGIFIPARLLASAGYAQIAATHSRVERMVNLFDKSELVEIADRLGVARTGAKWDLAHRILHKF